METEAIKALLAELEAHSDLRQVMGVDAKIREARVELTALESHIAELKKEKVRRIGYQSIVYSTCNIVDRMFGLRTRAGQGCTTSDVIERLEQAAKERERNKARIAELEDALRGALRLITKHHTHGYKADLVDGSLCRVCTIAGGIDLAPELAAIGSALAGEEKIEINIDLGGIVTACEDRIAQLERRE